MGMKARKVTVRLYACRDGSITGKAKAPKGVDLRSALKNVGPEDVGETTIVEFVDDFLFPEDHDDEW